MYEVKVRLLSALCAFDRPYSYLSERFIEAGTLVALPFGKSNRHQYSVAIACKEAESTQGLKKILFTLPEQYSLTPLQQASAEFISERFFCSFGDSARLMLPTGLDIETEEYVVKGESFHLIEQDTCDLSARLTKDFEDADELRIGKMFTKADLASYIKK